VCCGTLRLLLFPSLQTAETDSPRNSRGRHPGPSKAAVAAVADRAEDDDDDLGDEAELDALNLTRREAEDVEKRERNK
jgi:hypothetical protein